jgi:hypothetical protein
MGRDLVGDDEVDLVTVRRIAQEDQLPRSRQNPVSASAASIDFVMTGCCIQTIAPFISSRLDTSPRKISCRANGKLQPHPQPWPNRQDLVLHTRMMKFDLITVRRSLRKISYHAIDEIQGPLSKSAATKCGTQCRGRVLKSPANGRPTPPR